MNFRATPGLRTLYYEILTETRAIAAEWDGITERPWPGVSGAPAASDVSIIPRGSGTGIWNNRRLERDARYRAIDRPEDHAHPGKRGANAPSENRTPARADGARLLHQPHTKSTALPTSSPYW